MEDFNPVLALTILALLPLAVPVGVYALLKCLTALTRLLMLGPDRARLSFVPLDL
jgi:hypothetical protein